MPTAPLCRGVLAAGLLAASASTLAVPCTGVSSTGRNLYVDARAGADTNPGTRANPFATVSRAAALARPGDTVWLRTGTYRETVTPARSGTRSRRITYSACPNEKPVVSGADPITGWSLSRGAVHTAPMPWTMNDGVHWWHRGVGGDQVFVDGVMMVEARWPNLPAGTSPADFTRDRVAESLSGTIVTPGVATNDPASARYGVSRLPGGADALAGASLWFVPGNHWIPMSGTVTASDTSSVTFSFKWNADLANPASPYRIRDRDHFFVYGTLALLDAPREWVRDAQGVLHLWSPDGQSPAGRTVEAKRRDLAFDLRGRSHITLHGLGVFAAAIDTDALSTGLVFSQLDGRYMTHGIWNDWWWASGTFERPGVRLEGTGHVLRDSRLQYSADAAVIVRGSQHQVVNNLIRGWGYSGILGGVDVKGSSHEISHNTIRDAVSWMGIAYGGQASRIAYNDVSRTGKLFFDQAAIYITYNTDGAGTEIDHNLVHDTLALHEWDQGYAGSQGIYFDPGSRNFKIHHNVIWNVTGKSLMLLGDPQQPLVNFQVCGNTLASPMAFITNGQDIELQNNIVSDWLVKQFTGVDSHNLEGGDPRYVAPSSGNFTLQAGSPAIDAGAWGTACSGPFSGAAPDIGAYEYGLPAWRAGYTAP